MSRKWTFHPHDESGIRRLSGQLKISPLLAQVLIARGFGDGGEARAFLDAKLTDLHDPSQLPGIDSAADLIIAAMKDKRRITIYGDYDVDGVTGTSILWHCLQLNNATVDYYIPCRLEEGYGLNKSALQQLHEEDPRRLVVSVDCGIASVAEADFARSIGLDLIITDHHPSVPNFPTRSLWCTLDCRALNIHLANFAALEWLSNLPGRFVNDLVMVRRHRRG